MVISTFETEEKLMREGYDFVIGIDEAGRGPLAGPVVACAAVLRANPSPVRITGHPLPNTGEEDKKSFEMIRDSKTLSEKQREKMFDFIHEHFYVGVGLCDHDTIDRINVLEAAYLAMKKAITNLVSSIKYNVSSMNIEKNTYIIHDTKYIILIDGNRPIPNFSMEQVAVIGGDKTVKSISAASIVAKVTRDRIMREMDEIYPEYGFIKHKGYGTKIHTDAIKKNGPCPIHRKSFEPIRSWTKE